MTIKPIRFRLAFSLRIPRQSLSSPFFKSATEITALVSGTGFKTGPEVTAALSQVAYAIFTTAATNYSYLNLRLVAGTFALKFIPILRLELRTLAQVHWRMSTVQN